MTNNNRGKGNAAQKKDAHKKEDAKAGQSKSGQPIQESELGGTLAKFCSITNSAAKQVALTFGLGDSQTAIDKGRNLIVQGWASAFDKKEYKIKKQQHSNGYEITFIFDGLALDSGKQKFISVIIRREDDSKTNHKPFYVYAADKIAGSGRTYAKLSDFATMESNKLVDLKNLALPEPWSLNNPGGTELLTRYLNGTFLRLEDEHKIAEAKDTEGSMAVFNTGLVDHTFKDIYCFCIPNFGSAIPWMVYSFCIEGATHSGLRIQGAFGDNPPQRAEYFTDKSDLMFDPNLKLVPDYSHMLRRLGRVELDSLKTRIFKHSPKALKVISDAEGISKFKKREEALNDGLAEVLDADPQLAGKVTKIFSDACEVAEARARYMYSSVIPAWNPKNYEGGDMVFCMPLCLVKQGHVDTVLVVKLQKEAAHPFYAGKTLDTVAMAYMNARTIQRTDGMTGWIASALPKQQPMEDESAFGFTPTNYEPSTSAAVAVEANKAKEQPQLAAKPQSKVAAEPQTQARLAAKPQPKPAATGDAMTPKPVSDSSTTPARPLPTFTLKADGWQFLVHPGDTIGRHRNAQQPAPQLVIPNDDTNFKYVSRHQGRFTYENGAWFFTQLKGGANTTEIFFDGDDTYRRELNKGDKVPLTLGDELSFAGSPRFRVSR